MYTLYHSKRTSNHAHRLCMNATYVSTMSSTPPPLCHRHYVTVIMSPPLCHRHYVSAIMCATRVCYETSTRVLMRWSLRNSTSTRLIAPYSLQCMSMYDVCQCKLDLALHIEYVIECIVIDNVITMTMEILIQMPFIYIYITYMWIWCNEHM